MKLFIIVAIFSNILFAKSCYKDKSKDEIICFYKYFDRKSIYKPKDDETYYLTSNRSIYAISDKIEVKFNAVGAIISILNDFEIDFYDKLKNETYIFQVRNKDELFSILTNLNNLTAVQKAIPSKKRKYTKTEIQKRIQKSKERQKKAMEKGTTQGGKKQVGFDQNFENSGSGVKGKNFLSGEH